MLYKFRRNGLVKRIAVLEARVDKLKVAEREYGKSYYTDKYIEACEDLAVTKKKLELLDENHN